MYSESLIFRHPIVESFFGMFLQQDLSVCHFFHICKGSTVTPQWQSPISGRVDTWDPFFLVDLLRCFWSFHRKSTSKMTIIINYSFLRSPKSSTLWQNAHRNGKKTHSVKMGVLLELAMLASKSWSGIFSLWTNFKIQKAMRSETCKRRITESSCCWNEHDVQIKWSIMAPWQQ